MVTKLGESFVCEFKPRKAKFGFKSRIRGSNLLSLTEKLRSIVYDTTNEQCWMEIKTDGYNDSCELIIYVNESVIADAIRKMGEFVTG